MRSHTQAGSRFRRKLNWSQVYKTRVAIRKYIKGDLTQVVMQICQSDPAFATSLIVNRIIRIDRQLQLFRIRCQANKSIQHRPPL